MQVAYSLRDSISVEINTAAKAELLTAMNNDGIVFRDVVSNSELVICGRICRSDYKKLCALLDKRGETMITREHNGIYYKMAALFRRPVLVISLVLLVVLSVILPMHILFVQVDGNCNVPTNRILEEAANAGVSLGTIRRSVHSEQVKNALLSSIPELQWAGVNTYGCVAKISVKEHIPVEDEIENARIASVVARCDGVIKSITVVRGNPVCSVGQAVTQNQTLVSAYTDCGKVIKATRAEAEIVGLTYHTVLAFSPLKTLNRSETVDRRICYCLKIGKKLIKLYKDSGISDTGCAKISKEYPINLPGGFLIPIALVQEAYVQSAFVEEKVNTDVNMDWLYQMTDQYLSSQLIAGEILQKKYSANTFTDAMVISAEYICQEMIGMVREEETDFYGKRN